jgi:hypothetical protein
LFYFVNFFKNCNYTNAKSLFRINGDRNSNITASGLDISKSTTKTEFLVGAVEKSLVINK